MDIFSTLKSRFPAHDSRVSDLKSMFDNVASFGPHVANWRKEAGSNKHLSEAGAAAAFRNRMNKDIMQTIRHMRSSIEESKGHLETARKKVTQPEYNRDDALAAAHRREIRDFLRSTPDKDRIHLVAGETADPLFVEAALELPPIVSGLTSQQEQLVRQAYAEKFKPEVLDHITVREEALSVMTAMDGVVRTEFAKHAGLDKKQFDAWYDHGIEPASE